MNRLSLFIYIPLQILFLPFAILGITLTAYKQMVVSRKLGTSQTAIEIINGRWTMHIFGMRQDEATAKLAAQLPNTSLLGLWLLLFPLWVKYKICGQYFAYPRIPLAGKETLADLVITRTRYIDNIIKRTAPTVEQFVLLGAGYDTRAYSHLNTHLAVYEVDQLSTQSHKLKGLAQAGIPHKPVHFVTADFNQESIFDKLIQSGYNPAQKTFFLWEGVTLYLSEENVRKTLSDIRRYSPAGGVVIADFYAQHLLSMGKSKAGKKVLNYTSENFGFGLPLTGGYGSALKDFINSEQMSVGETHFLGATGKNSPFAVVAELGL